MDIKEELKNQVDSVFNEMGLNSLSDDEKKALEEKIIDRLDRVILEATLLSLNEDQLKEFEAALDDPENTEALITELTSRIPGLSARIDMAIRNEWEGIKKSIGSTA